MTGSPDDEASAGALATGSLEESSEKPSVNIVTYEREDCLKKLFPLPHSSSDSKLLKLFEKIKILKCTQNLNGDHVRNEREGRVPHPQLFLG